MDCPVCRLDYDSDERQQFGLPCAHRLCGKCCAKYRACPECNRSFTSSEIRHLGILSPQSVRAQTALDDLRALRLRVKEQNAAAKVAVCKTLDLVMQRLSSLRLEIVAEIEAAEVSNVAGYKQQESMLQSTLRSTDPLKPTFDRSVSFAQYCFKDDSSEDLLLYIAALRRRVTSTQVATPSKSAYATKYVPVKIGEAVKWVYEHRGVKKAFTPDFAAALERAHAHSETQCELRDKQQKLIFQVNLKTFTSYRPGGTGDGCPIAREA